MSQSPEASDRILEIRKVTKTFPGVVALQDVDLVLKRGEMLGLVGENGAGKSTLMKILGGLHRPDRGEILVDGRPADIPGVTQASRLGIALIHQELNLADNLTVADNVFLGREPRGAVGLVDRARTEREAGAILKRLGVDLSPRTRVSELPLGLQQMVEIAKALSQDARILILDEPTSSLWDQEAGRLFRVLRDLKKRGVSMIYISHRLKEIESLCDRVAGLRDGRNSGELPRGRICRDEMLRLMVGRDVAQFYHRAGQARDSVALEVRGLEVRGRAGRPVDFQVRAGEIVGLAGLVGSGRTEIAHALFGITPPLAGEILLDGKPVVIRSPRDAIRAGMALVPEDRKAQGVILEMTIEENIALPSLPRHRRFGLVRRAPLAALARDLTSRLAVRTPSVARRVRMLSGGNQQKVVLAKWLALKPRVLLLDDPTRGIDVVAKEEIYRLMEKLAGEGVAILLISSELQEVLGVADRVLVMSEGRLTGELPENEFSEEAVMHLATGGKARG